MAHEEDASCTQAPPQMEGMGALQDAMGDSLSNMDELISHIENKLFGPEPCDIGREPEGFQGVWYGYRRQLETTRSYNDRPRRIMQALGG